MLYWICPECGHECSPAVRECPTCSVSDARAAAVSSAHRNEGVSHAILALVRTFQSVPSVPLLAAGPGNGGPANGHSSMSYSALAEEGPSPANEAIDGVVRPLVESAALDSRQEIREPLWEPNPLARALELEELALRQAGASGELPASGETEDPHLVPPLEPDLQP